MISAEKAALFPAHFTTKNLRIAVKLYQNGKTASPR